MSLTEIKGDLLPLLEEISKKSNEPEWLLEVRKKVLELIRVVPSDYSRHFKMDKILDEWLKAVLNRGLEDKLECCPKDIIDEEKPEGIVIDVINGRVFGYKLPKELRDKGIFVTDLRVALKNRENEIRRLLVERVNRGLTDKMEALNLALFTNGIYIEVPDKVKLDVPIHIRRYFTDDFQNKFQTDIINIGNLAEITIYDDYLKSQRDVKEKKVSITTDIYTGESSKVIYNSVSLVGNNIDLTIHRNMLI